jgi:hypothetical protein
MKEDKTPIQIAEEISRVNPNRQNINRSIQSLQYTQHKCEVKLTCHAYEPFQ